MGTLGFINNLFQGADGIILLFIILLLFGAKRLPELARGLGSALKEFNQAKDDVKDHLTRETATPLPAPARVLVEHAGENTLSGAQKEV